MKLSTYHKSLGDHVEPVLEGGEYDKVYLSKTFNLPLIRKIPQEAPLFSADEVAKGGTGYAIKLEDGKEVFHPEIHSNLPYDIEHLYPDYTFYPQYEDTAYGFLTRGCCNNCSFCIVCAKEGRKAIQVAELSEFWRGQKIIKLLDPNLLACRQREKLLRQLIDSRAQVDFTQGLDVRFMTEDVVQALLRMRVKAIHFAFDFMKNEAEIIRGFQIFNRYYTKSKWNVKCYVLTNYDTTNEEDWYRVCKIREYSMIPDVRIYQKGTQNQFLTDLQRWCNNPRLSRSIEFADYVPRVDGKSCGELYPDILKGGNFIMATTKKTEVSKEENRDVSTMGVHEKLLAVRSEFSEANAKKSGRNLHAEFMYFELSDIVPIAEKLFAKYGLLLIPTFEETRAVAKIVNIHNSAETLEFSIPLRFMEEPGKFRMNEVQGVGAVVTYYRRYLYMIVLDLVESDEIDGDIPTGKDKSSPASKAVKKTPASNQERKKITEELTESDGQASELQISALKEALKQLLEIDSEQESFVQSVAVKTEAFSKITKAQCEQLINGVSEMLAAYETQKED